MIHKTRSSYDLKATFDAYSIWLLGFRSRGGLSSRKAAVRAPRLSKMEVKMLSFPFAQFLMH
jgi:hypothetical protein